MSKRIQLAVALGAPFVVATLPLLAFLPFSGTKAPTVEVDHDGVVATIDAQPVSQSAAYGIGTDCPLGGEGHLVEG